MKKLEAEKCLGSKLRVPSAYCGQIAQGPIQHLRNGSSDDSIAEWLEEIVWQKEARHHIGEPEFVPPPRSMSWSASELLPEPELPRKARAVPSSRLTTADAWTMT